MKKGPDRPHRQKEIALPGGAAAPPQHDGRPGIGAYLVPVGIFDD